MGSGDQADPGRPDEAAFAGLEDEAATSYAPRAWQRAYLGYKERFVDDAYLKLRGGSVSLCIRQAPSAKALPATAANSRKGGGKAAAASVSPSDGDRGSDPALTATTLWDGAIVLAQLLTATDVLAQHAGSWPSGGRLPRCIELGAGTGAVSLALMACRCVESATVTDLPGALEHIRTNVLRNNRHVDPSRVHVRPLRCARPAAAKPPALLR